MVKIEKVLIVDDEVHVLDVVERILIKQGYEVNVATGGESGLKMVEKVKPDLILLDLMMPGINGFQVAKRLKENEDTRTIPIMAFSILTKDESEELGNNKNFDGYLAKPFSIAQLVSSINGLAEGKLKP